MSDFLRPFAHCFDWQSEPANTGCGAKNAFTLYVIQLALFTFFPLFFPAFFRATNNCHQWITSVLRKTTLGCLTKICISKKQVELNKLRQTVPFKMTNLFYLLFFSFLCFVFRYARAYRAYEWLRPYYHRWCGSVQNVYEVYESLSDFLFIGLDHAKPWTKKRFQ